MNRYRLHIGFVLIFLLGVTTVFANDFVIPPAPTAEEIAEAEANRSYLEAGQNECGGNNLLFNSSFEGEYSAYDPPGGHPDCIWGPCNSAQMADGWTPFWRSHDPSDPGWIYIMPEWKPATTDFTDPVRVRSGERAQQWFTFYATHDAGIYQQVNGTTPGANYCLSVWAHGWSNNNDDPYSDPVDHGFLNQFIGIDPTGGTDYLSQNIVWTAPTTQYDEYGLFKLDNVMAQAESMTVFFRSEPLFAVKHNDVYWDDAIFAMQGGAPPSMVLSETWFDFSAELDTPTTQYADVTIQLNNDPTLTWSAEVVEGSQFTPTLNPASGTPDDTNLQIGIDSTGLAVGSYTAWVHVEASDPSIAGGSQTITLNLEVLDSAPSMVVEDTWFVFEADEFSAETHNAHVDITMTNANDLTWSATVEPTSQFTPQLSQSVGNPNDDLDITFDTLDLEEGFYEAYVRIEASDPSIEGGSALVTIQLTVDDVTNPTIIQDDLLRVYLVEVDNPQEFNEQITIDLANADGLRWMATVDTNSDFFPIVTNGTGFSGETLEYTIYTIGLPVGTYNATINVVIDDATFIDPPMQINIQLVIEEEFTRLYLPTLINE